MFVKIGNRYINMANVTFVEDQNGERYALHFSNAEHQALTFNNGVLNDTSYADLRRFLVAQQAQAGIRGAAAEQPLYPSAELLPNADLILPRIGE